MFAIITAIDSLSMMMKDAANANAWIVWLLLEWLLHTTIIRLFWLRKFLYSPGSSRKASGWFVGVHRVGW